MGLLAIGSACTGLLAGVLLLLGVATLLVGLLVGSLRSAISLLAAGSIAREAGWGRRERQGRNRTGIGIAQGSDSAGVNLKETEHEGEE